MESMIYLDNNSTTPVLPEVVEAMLPCFAASFGNPSSIHASGRRALASVKEARGHIAELIDCEPGEVIFTSGGTEGDNLALQGMMNAGDHMIVSAIEHSAILSVCARLEVQGCEVTRVEVNTNGQVEPASIKAALRKNTRLISVMMANNETGVLQPVDEIGRIAAEADVWFHTDAVQAAGKVPISVKTIRCDLLTISAHKMHGPQGIGALYLRRGTPLRPQLYGGHQEKRRRPGTENVAGIVGFGKASQIARSGLTDGSLERVAAMRNRLERELTNCVPQVWVNGKDAPRVANTSNMLFSDAGGDALVVALDDVGIAASRGAACASGAADPSSVLMAMGLSGEQSRSSVRFSLGKQNTEDEIERAIALIPACVSKVRQRSTVYWNA